MKFVCAYRVDGHPLTERDFAPFVRTLAHVPGTRIVYDGAFAAAAACIAEDGARIAVGNVHMGHGRRLPALLSALAGTNGSLAESCSRWMGDFGVVVYDRTRREVLAARDPFGVRSLFTATVGDIVLFSSHLALLEAHVDSAYDPEYVADFLIEGGTRTCATILRDVRVIAAGSSVVQRASDVRLRTFWSPWDHAAQDEDPGREADDVSKFRELFREAVQFNLGSEGETWSQLSGGLDSSSIVCMAKELSGIAGTVTVYDDLCDADERVFVDAVTDHTGVANVKLVGFAAWQGGDAPRTDVPSVLSSHHAMRARMETAVTSAGGRVLLSGAGSDHFLDGRPVFLADHLARGQVGAAVRGAFEFAVEERTSIWTVLGRCGAVPLLPASVQMRFLRTGDAFPRFLRGDFLRLTSANDRFRHARAALGPAGRKFDGTMARKLADLPSQIEMDRFEQVEQRYPFLYRPLVEHGLRTAARLRARPAQRKWILREAMRGSLPEVVRTRKSHGGLTARTLWAMSNERARWETWLRDPFVAQHGWVEPALLRDEIDALVGGRSKELLPVLRVLALEEWFRARASKRFLA